METCLIQVPYMAGDDRQGASKGPERLAIAAAEVLGGKGVNVAVAKVKRGAPFGDSASASLMVCKELAATVRRATAAGQFPLVMAGSCDASKGVLSGLGHGNLGVVWIDAHGDFNTPETTCSGFFPGMSLAVITGHCYRSYWSEIGGSVPIEESAILLVGVRDLDPAERQRLEQSTIQVVEWRQGKPQRSVEDCLRTLANRVREVYLHVDMDALDPRFAPGVADKPVPGGLSLQNIEELVRGVVSRFRIRAATVATYNPDLDQDDRTLTAGLFIIDLLAESYGQNGTSRGGLTGR